jgi:NAD(P)-dependent dehydrogenase (short-subunit alcohol dehydrogenase family)
MDLQLTDKVVVVTGASKGIGLAITEHFLDEGARVVASSRGTSPELDALAGDRLVHVTADLSEPDAPAEVIARAVEAFGGLDVLVNNVGTARPRGGFLATTDEDWQSIFELNLFGVVRATRAALPLLVERGGNVINVSSINARMPAPILTDYSASKAALTNLSKALSEEFAPQGVRINAVSPGPVRTPLWTGEGMTLDFFAGMLGTDRDAALATALPEMMSLTTGRFAEPEEVAALVVLLASPVSASTTGAEFVLDSGAVKTT